MSSPEPPLVLHVSCPLSDKCLPPNFRPEYIDQGRSPKGILGHAFAEGLHEATSHPSDTCATNWGPLRNCLARLLPALQRREPVMERLLTFGLTLDLANDDECHCL